MSSKGHAVPGRGGVRWLPLGVAVVLLAVVVWAFATELDGIMGSNPAYLITLLVVAAGAVGVALFAILSRPVRQPGVGVGAGGWVARVALVVGGLLVAGTLVYLRPASAESIAIAALDSGGGVTVEISDSMIKMTPDVDAYGTGLVFHPGGLVDPRAYAHILRPVAEAGFPVRITMPPYNLAVLSSDAAGAVVGDPDDAITQWVIGGHSLGGAMAAQYAESERDELVGLLLYAAYPVRDMSERTGLDVLSVSGTNDGLATPEDIENSVTELPPSAQFVPIEGAIHAFFGDYGSQRGDGTPTVDRTVAQDAITEVTIGFLETLEGAPRR
jgi:pimeloyl-ACP methyl ester carboxylesterase